MTRRSWPRPWSRPWRRARAGLGSWSPRCRRAAVVASGTALLVVVALAATTAFGNVRLVSRAERLDRPGAATSAGGQGGQAAEPVVTDPRLAAMIARLPRFAPPPPAHPVPLPPGPSAAWFGAVATTQPVAFLTIDDGWTKVPEAVDLLRAARVPVSLFLEINAIRDDPGYFARLQAVGATIQAHTITHPQLRGKPYELQRREICGSADQLGALYGQRPTLFRPPFGEKDATTLRAVHDCGMRAALFWRETVNTGVVRYQVGASVAPGDIILMHFRPAFVDDFVAALQAIAAAGLVPARLEDYLR